ncbi:molybdopterin oxidoreductase family protein [Methanobrevibacter sp. DSM 116169]|uniref:molybdopterin oxidoreductase family protein n=1 Tax=Methanobrevibacter sp. DSM 116169 TaxID=3242727 RepID=UPI0038FBECD8
MIIEKSICPSCSVGCGINLIYDNNKIVGTYPYKRHFINEGKNCLRGRDSYKTANQNRILKPLIKSGSKTVETDLNSAIEKVAQLISSASKEDIGIISSGCATNEENKIISSFAKEYGINNLGFYNENFIKSTEEVASYDDLNSANFILIIGDVIKENPLIGRRIMIAKDNGAEIITCDTENLTISSLNSNKHYKLDSVSDLFNDFPDKIKNKLDENSVIVFNKLGNNEELDEISKIANNSNSKILPILKDCNSYGSMDYLNALEEKELIDLINNVKVLILFNEDLSSYLDGNLDSLIYIGTNLNETSQKADITLPGCIWIEKGGTFTNTIGITQEFNKIQNPPEDVLEEIELIKQIGDKLNINIE